MLLAGGLILDFLRPSQTGFLSAWFWPAAAVCSVLELAMALPIQNAIAASFQTAGMVWLITVLGHCFGVSVDVAPRNELQLPGGVSAAFVASWIALSPCYRAVSRAVLIPRRSKNHVGLEILGVTSVLSGGTVWVLQPTVVHHNWQVLPLWIATAAVLHTVNTPWLLNKRPARESSGIGSLALPGLICIGMMQSLPGATAWQFQATAALSMLLALGLAWRGLVSAR